MRSGISRAALCSAALQARGFHLVDQTVAVLNFEGRMLCGGDRLRVRVQVDRSFRKLPRIWLLERPNRVTGRVLPHLSASGELCYATDSTVVLDVFDPGGQLLGCLERASEVITKVLRGELVEDLADEFLAHWPGVECFLDVEDDACERLVAVAVTRGRRRALVITDELARSLQKLAAANFMMDGWHKVSVGRVRISGRLRQIAENWPPSSVKQIAAWLVTIDPVASRHVYDVLLRRSQDDAPIALMLLDAPSGTCGFGVIFDRAAVRSDSRELARSLVFSLSLQRMDDRYLAQRSMPSSKTLIGLRIALVGCGTIGGFLAELLTKLGAGGGGGELSLIDPGVHKVGNVGRQRLPLHLVGHNKAIALAREMRRLAPTVKIDSYPVDAYEMNLADYDLVIDSTGEEALSHLLVGKLQRKSVPSLTIWLEQSGKVARGLLRRTVEGPCVRCLCDFDRAHLFPSLREPIASRYGGQGCEAPYVEFPVMSSVKAAALGADMVMSWANGETAAPLWTRSLDDELQLACGPRTRPPRREDCPACRP